MLFDVSDNLKGSTNQSNDTNDTYVIFVPG